MCKIISIKWLMHQSTWFGTCDSEKGYGEEEDGNCNICIDTFFIKRNDSDGRPECQGMTNKILRINIVPFLPKLI